VTTVAALVADLRARGVRLEPRGAGLAVRPVAALTPAELEALRRHKPEVLALLTAPTPTLPRLNPHTVREALGARPAPHAVACVAWNVMDAVRQLEAEIASGVIEQRARRVAGRPLGDWLGLDDVARLLRAWGERSRSEPSRRPPR
jgi:hypothetical protein